MQKTQDIWHNINANIKTQHTRTQIHEKDNIVLGLYYMNAYIKTHNTQAHDTHTHRTDDIVLYLHYTLYTCINI